MAFSAGDRTLFLFLMASPAPFMVSSDELDLSWIIFFSMALGTGHIFGAFTLHKLSILIHMVTKGTVVNSGIFIMTVMDKTDKGPGVLCKNLFIYFNTVITMADQWN